MQGRPNLSIFWLYPNTILSLLIHYVLMVLASLPLLGAYGPVVLVLFAAFFLPNQIRFLRKGRSGFYDDNEEDFR